MSFDPRSLERLRELGRQLPRPLPTPDASSTAEPRASKRRHRIETEDNPQALFQELMQVSPDGTVPPHLMARLKDAEAKRQIQEQPQGVRQQQGEMNPLDRSSSARKGKTTVAKTPPLTPGSTEESLYVAFGQLLLEDEDEDEI